MLTLIAVIEAILLAAVTWSTRRKPARARVRIARGADDIPHAL
jgi:hypothetical protein